MKVLDLFSGIGGFSLGLHRAGMETVAFCEIDAYCRKVLAKHWPSIPIHDDVKLLDGSQYVGAVDVICGGYPCQPFSVAGNQLGEEDPRHLWPEMLRIIRGSRPRWVICENVSGHVKLGFDTVASQLEAEGFAVWSFLIPACAIGAPHKRERLWIVANARGGRCGRQADREVEQQRRTETERSGQASADSTQFSHEQSVTQPGQRTVAGGNCEGHRGHWAVESDVGRVAHGIPKRVDRLRALGNAVVPQIPELIGRTIIEYERQLALTLDKPTGKAK